MTEKQLRFCEAYLACGNAQQASREAGYSLKNGHNNNAARTLFNPEVQAYLSQKFKELSGNNSIASAEEVLSFLSAVMRGAVPSLCPIQRNGKVAFASRLPTLKERMSAATLLGKRYGLFTEKISIEDASEVVFSEINIPD